MLTTLQTAYSVIEPGATRLYRTYCTHPWIVREVATGARMLLSGAGAVVGMAHEQTVDISDPPLLAWGVSGMSRPAWVPGMCCRLHAPMLNVPCMPADSTFYRPLRAFARLLATLLCPCLPNTHRSSTTTAASIPGSRAQPSSCCCPTTASRLTAPPAAPARGLRRSPPSPWPQVKGCARVFVECEIAK